MPSSGDSSRARRVLVVDDDPLSREAIGVTLSDAGFDVRCAAGAAEANELAARDGVDVVVADICMPGNEHLEWMAELAERHPGLATVLVTGKPSLDTAMKAVALPIRASLLKPVPADVLVAEVSRALAEGAAEPLDDRVPRVARRWEHTERQTVVHAEIVTGASNKDIAARLDCKLRTVEDHLSAIMSKAGVTSRGRLLSKFWAG
jgi:DNA-binding NarL/FixJ family response regulator